MKFLIRWDRDAWLLVSPYFGDSRHTSFMDAIAKMDRDVAWSQGLEITPLWGV